MFDPDLYREVRKPLLQAHTLPSHCYTSDEFFQREVENIFSSAWHFVGRADELAGAGDFLVVDTKAGSALVCRSADRQLHGFVNACRHRGTRLKSNAGNCRNIICPYHAWIYELNGKLKAAPGMEQVENFDTTDFGLQPLRLQTWGGFIFVNLDNTAPDLLDWIGDFAQRMEGHRLDELRCVKRIEFTIKANWKFLIANALEAYHTGIVHRDSLGAQESEPEQTRGQWDALYVLSDENKSIATLPGEVQAMPFIHGLNEKALKGTWFTCIYPCTQIVFSQDCVWWLDFKPLAADCTHLTIGACFPQSSITLPDFETRVAPYFRRWESATPEDNAIAEAQQQGHTAGLSMPGRYSAREHCVHALDNWVLDRVLVKPQNDVAGK